MLCDSCLLDYKACLCKKTYYEYLASFHFSEFLRNGMGLGVYYLLFYVNEVKSKDIVMAFSQVYIKYFFVVILKVVFILPGLPCTENNWS